MQGLPFPAPATLRETPPSSIEVAQRMKEAETRLANYQGLITVDIPMSYTQHLMTHAHQEA